MPRRQWRSGLRRRAPWAEISGSRETGRRAPFAASGPKNMRPARRALPERGRGSPARSCRRAGLAVALVHEQVARLALEIIADRVESLEADAFDPAGLEQAEIGLGDADMRGEVL